MKVLKRANPAKLDPPLLAICPHCECRIEFLTSEIKEQQADGPVRGSDYVVCPEPDCRTWIFQWWPK
jgi:hypothetical protein